MPIKTRQELIKKYIDFFKSKNHKEIPNSSLIPSIDPTVLFTTAGMHPLVPYLLEQPHPLGKNLVNVQKCIRTDDIDKIGDATHHTFFEMLGNWSLGDYWKKEAITFFYEFLTKILKLQKEKLKITCFKGDKNSPKDKESAKVWQSLGIPKEHIIFLGKEDNWWGPIEKTGPCGPCTEIFYWMSNKPVPKKFNPKDLNWSEIGNDVFMEYNKTKSGKYKKLKQKNVDFGGGVERTFAVLNKFDDDYLSPTFLPIIKQIEKISRRNYEKHKHRMRIIADHIKAAIFIIADGITPGNTGQGYVLRRLIRRSIRHGQRLDLKNFTAKIAQPVFEIYPDYPELKKNRNHILTILDEEENKFNKTIEKGLMIFNKKVMEAVEKKEKSPGGKEYYRGLDLKKGPIGIISGKEAFLLYQSYGFPIEQIIEEAKDFRGGIFKVDIKGFEREYKKHQALSRKATKGMFRSGLADSSEKTIKLHTATHLLNEALRRVLGNEVKQRGSNITPERLRFDFNFPRKLTDKEIKQVEDLVNKKINEGLKIVREETSLKKALDSGAQAEFGHKYPEKVSLYTILDPKDKKGFFSKEICTGPHVRNTAKIGTFKIVKEQSSAAGVRRIKAILE